MDDDSDSMNEASLSIGHSPTPARNAGDAVKPKPNCSDNSSGSDIALMTRLASNESGAMNELIEQYGNWLATLVGRLLSWSSDHEDVLQDVLVQVWQKAHTFRGNGSLEGWLRRMAVNRCNNHHRWHNRFRQMLVSLMEFRDRTLATDAPQPSRLSLALQRLAPKDRTVIVLYYLEELSSDEIGKSLGIKTDSVHSRLHRARQKLKTVLESERAE